MREAIITTCDGEAHSNGHQDHCMVCLPYWGSYPTCPDCNVKLKRPRSGSSKARCTNSACASHNRWFSLAAETL